MELAFCCLLWLVAGVIQPTNALQPSKIPRVTNQYHGHKDVVSRRNYKNTEDGDINSLVGPDADTDDTLSTTTNDDRSGKILPNLRLSQVVKSIHNRAQKRKKKTQDLLDDLHLAYTIAGDEIRLANDDEEAVPAYADFVHKKRMMTRLDKTKKRRQFVSRFAVGKRRPKVPVRTAEELRSAVLDRGRPLKDVQLNKATNAVNVTDPMANVLDHEVLKLIVDRFESGSKPSARAANDTARLALAIEGGGMRGAVSAGMAAAIACLGLCDTFDAVYGSSAGSVVGSYMISRQMCIDVYLSLLTAAKRTFVSKGRIFAHLTKNLAKVVLTNRTSSLATAPLRKLTPGLNISFVLEGIMCPQNGLRPLDVDAFRANDRVQPLRVVASSLRRGQMETVCFGSEEGDFFDQVGEDGMVSQFATTSADGRRHGLFSCLEASMSVPGAAGPPIDLIRSQDSDKGIVTSAFDAFCYEPLPYRSAIEEGHTHALVLRSRPDGFPIKTKPGIYERTIASLYFRSHGQPEVASYFERGGQQYIYAEDILTLQEAQKSRDAVPVPPNKILYGATEAQSGEAHHLSEHRSDWKKAHLLPIAVPEGTPELKSLEQSEEEVLQAVRSGFAAAYDVLSPAVGLEIEGLDGKRVAELFFPFYNSTEAALQQPKKVHGEPIAQNYHHPLEVMKHERRRKRYKRFLRDQEECVVPDEDEVSMPDDKNCGKVISLRSQKISSEPCPKRDARTLLAFLPGLQSGRLAPLAEGLTYHKNGCADVVSHKKNR